MKSAPKRAPVTSEARVARAKRPSEAAAPEPARVPGKRGPKVDVEQTLRRKREILRGAARLFDRVGYHGVNMSMIAEAAGVKKPTLYHYIKSKDEILFMLHELFIGTLRKNTDARIEQGADELEILRGVIVDTLRLMHDYPGYMRAFFEHTRELGKEQRAVIAARFARAAVASGSLPPPLPIGMVVAPNSDHLNGPRPRPQLAPSSGLAKELPSSATPGPSLLTRPSRSIGASSSLTW